MRRSSLLNVAANGLWTLLCLPGSLAFRRSLRDVAETQRKLLLRLLHRQADTVIGRRYGFAGIRSVSDYQDRVPLSIYEDYQAAIERIGSGQTGVLTDKPVLLLEPTSGSTAATKYIPYTASLKAEFQRAIAPWIVDIFGHEPGLLRGQAYWSISPVTHRQQRTPGGIPIGFEDDNEYFGLLQRHLLQRIMAVPASVRLIDDLNTFRYVTLLFLLRSRSLTLISVWNPTFLSLLVEPLNSWWPRLAADIGQGELSPPAPLPPQLLTPLQAWNSPDPQRANEISSAFQLNNTLPDVHARLWPNLRLISCWADAQAAPRVPRLARLFPQARLQGKGLLATEGIVSFPLAGQPGHVLALRSHFFEFLPLEDRSDRPLLAHQLERDGEYEVILTTGGGLYRYRLGDVVRVVGHLDTCPLLEFVGRAGQISDRFGEKLNEYPVQQALEALFKSHALQPDFAMIACEESLEPPAYTLFIEAKGASDQLLKQLAAALDAALRENFHYAYCRDLQQLGPLRAFRISAGALQTYHAECRKSGQRSGDIKPVTLHRGGSWAGAFRGRIISLTTNHGD
jgi:hypothetical protein